MLTRILEKILEVLEDILDLLALDSRGRDGAIKLIEKTGAFRVDLHVQV